MFYISLLLEIFTMKTNKIKPLKKILFRLCPYLPVNNILLPKVKLECSHLSTPDLAFRPILIAEAHKEDTYINALLVPVRCFSQYIYIYIYIYISYIQVMRCWGQFKSLLFYRFLGVGSSKIGLLLEESICICEGYL